MVRCDGVPTDLPCEQCASKKYIKPSEIAAAASHDPLPQFIWHGQNYLEKMWTDVHFLTENIAVKKYAPGLLIEGNPLLLDNHTYFKGLDDIGVNLHDPLSQLKGRREQIEDAAKAGTVVPPKPNRWEFMGTEYMKSHFTKVFKHLSLEYQKLTAKIDRYKLSQSGAGMKGASGGILRTKSSPAMATASTSTSISARHKGMSDTHGIDAAGHGLETASQSQFLSADEAYERERARKNYTAWSTLTLGLPGSPSKGQGGAKSNLANSTGSMFPPIAGLGHSRGRGSKTLTWDPSFIADPSDEYKTIVERERLVRALGVLCQSAQLSITELPPAVLPERLQITALQRNPLQHPTLPSEYRRKMAEGLAYVPPPDTVLESEEYREELDIAKRHPDSGLTGQLVATLASYPHKGFNLTSTQFRPPIANRDDAIWCRSDVGEWKGLTKGRNMRSFEFQDNLVQQNKRIIAIRMDVQKRLRSSLEPNFVSCNVPLIKSLIAEAQAIRGNPLQLDVLQAELYLKRRRQTIRRITRLKARFRGRRAR